MAGLPPPPPGFELDQPAAPRRAAVPPPPPGFQIDAAPVQTEASVAPPPNMIADIFTAPTPATPAPVPLMERFGANFREGADFTIQGVLAKVFDVLQADGVERRLRQWGDTEAADRFVRDRAAGIQQRKQQRDAMPSFTDAPTFGQKVLEGAVSLPGQIAGSALSPEAMVTRLPGISSALERYVAPKVASPALQRVIQAGGTQAVVNTAIDPAVQGGNMATGYQDQYDPVQTALAPALGFLVGGTLQGASELPGGLKGMADAYRAWRGRTVAPPKAGAAPAADVAPTPLEVDEFASSPEMAAFLKANGITAPDDPRVMQLQDRLSARRQAEGARAQVLPQDNVTVQFPSEPGPQATPQERAQFDAQRRTAARQERSSTPAFNEDQNRLAVEREAVQNGDIDPGAASTAGRVPRQPIPEKIPVTPEGQADIGDQGVRAGIENADRVRQETQAQADSAFRMADLQRTRAGSEVRDTQPATRPDGVAAEPVALDDGFPVKILSRRTVEKDGKVTEMAEVHRYDPRTGEVEADAIPYEVPVRQLRTANYAKEPRRSQDFVARAQSPRNPEQPRMATQDVRLEPDQTYRATPPDNNQDFPGATRPGPEDGASPEGRSPLPNQPDGPGPFRARPRSEEEAIRDFERRQARGDEQVNREKWQKEGPRKEDNKTSSTARPINAEGRFDVDDRGFVHSDKGGPVRFADQKQAAKWIINEGHKKSADQIFEIENHPSGKGFGVRERGRAEPGNEPPPPNGPSSQSQQAGGARAAGKGGSPGALPAPREAPQPKSRAPLSEGAQGHYESAVADVARARSAPVKKPRPADGSLFDAIRDLGGIRDDRGDVAQIMQGFKNERFKKRVFNPNGLHPDKMREALQEQGWFGPVDYQAKTGTRPGDDTRDLYDLMDKEARGERVFHPDYRPDDASMAAADEYEIRALLDEELDRAGVTEADTPEDAARKLAEFRASEEAEYLLREQESAVDDDLAGLSDADWERFDADDYEPGSDFGAEREAPEFSETGRQGQEDVPGRAEDREAGAGKADRGDGLRPEPEQVEVPGTERETAEDLKARAGRREADERQANPRAYSGKAQKGHADDGLFGDRSEKNQSDMFAEGEQGDAGSGLGNKFYSNPIGDPDLWRDLARSLSKFGWARSEAEAWSRHLESITTAIPKKDARGTGALAHVRNALSVAFFSNDGMLRSLSAKYKSSAIREIADLFYAAPRGGGDGAVKQTYFEALNERYGRWMNELDELMAPLAKLATKDRDAAMDQIGRLIVNPGAIKPGTPIHDAAAGIGKQLKDILAYMREAGVDVGEIKRGYLPRVENVDAIMASPEGFKKAATKAFVADGVTAKEARTAAEDWYNRILLGDIGVHSDTNDFVNIGGGTNTPNFTRGRVLSKKADEILGNFYLRNPADIMPRYILKAVRKAEWSRRLGKRDPKAKPPAGVDKAEWLADPLGRWKDLKQRMIDDGAAEVLPDVVQTIKSITGNIGQAATGGTRNFLSLARTWSAFTYLSRATFSSLSEPVSVAIRTGNTMDALRAYGNTVRHWVPALRKIGDGKYLEEMAKDLGFIGDAIDNLSMLQRVGNDDNSLVARRLQTNYFRMIGLTQFTESNRVAAMQGGMTFIRRLASDVANKSHYHKMSTKLLAELGIDDAAAFSKWVMERDGKPHLSDLLEGGDMGRLYHTALGRFIGQTVMAPSGAVRPRYAQHPLGSLFYNLMSFTYAFQKNVLNRVAAMTKEAVNPKSDLSAAERLAYLAPLGNLPALLAVQYALGEIRDQIFPDPARAGQQPKTVWDKLMTAFSRAGLTGITDPLLNTFTSVRYQRDPAIALAGPVYGTPLQVMGDAGDFFGDRNSPNTNTVERKAARDAYDLVVKPTLIAGATAVAPAGTPLGLALGAAGIFGAAHPAARERVVKAVAGPPQPRR